MSEQVNLLTTKEIFGKQFNIYGTILEPLFLAKDVAELIDYSKRSDGSYQVGQMIKSVDEDEKICTVNNVNGGREMWFLTENGLYEVLMQSRKPIAKEFKKQVKIILKEIRLYGGYIPGNTSYEINQNTLEINEKKIKNLEEDNDGLNYLYGQISNNIYNINQKMNSIIGYLQDNDSYFPTEIKREYTVQDVINNVSTRKVTKEDIKWFLLSLGWVWYDKNTGYLQYDNLRISSLFPDPIFYEDAFYELIDIISKSKKVLYY